jgi:hypothetical protein
MAGQSLTNVIKLLKATGTSPQAYDNVGNVVDANGPQFTNERIEVTDGDSPSNTKEYLAARQDPGPVQMTLNFNFDNVRHVALVTGMQESPPSVDAYRLQYGSDADNYMGGSAFVANFSLTGNTRGAALTAPVSLQPTGLWEISTAP